MKKSLALILAVVMVLCLGLTACTGNGGTQAKSEMTICVGPYPDTIDPALKLTVQHTLSTLSQVLLATSRLRTVPSSSFPTAQRHSPKQ